MTDSQTANLQKCLNDLSKGGDKAVDAAKNISIASMANPQHQKLCSSTSTIKLLISMMHSSNSDISKETAMRALVAIVGSTREHQDSCVACGVFPHLLPLLSSPTAKFAFEAMSLLGCLTNNHAENRAKAIALGVVPLVQKAARQRDNPTLQNIASIVGRTALQCDGMPSSLAGGGMLNPTYLKDLVAWVESGVSEKVRIAASQFASLLLNLPESVDSISASGVIPALVRFVHSGTGDPDLRIAVLGVLGVLLETGKNFNQAYKADAINVLVKCVLHDRNKDVRCGCIENLNHFTRGPETIKRALLSAGVARMAVQVLAQNVHRASTEGSVEILHALTEFDAQATLSSARIEDALSTFDWMLQNSRDEFAVPAMVIVQKWCKIAGPTAVTACGPTIITMLKKRTCVSTGDTRRVLCATLAMLMQNTANHDVAIYCGSGGVMLDVLNEDDMPTLVPCVLATLMSLMRSPSEDVARVGRESLYDIVPRLVRLLLTMHDIARTANTPVHELQSKALWLLCDAVSATPLSFLLSLEAGFLPVLVHVMQQDKNAELVTFTTAAMHAMTLRQRHDPRVAAQLIACGAVPLLLRSLPESVQDADSVYEYNTDSVRALVGSSTVRELVRVVGARAAAQWVAAPAGEAHKQWLMRLMMSQGAG